METVTCIMALFVSACQRALLAGYLIHPHGQVRMGDGRRAALRIVLRHIESRTFGTTIEMSDRVVVDDEWQEPLSNRWRWIYYLPPLLTRW